MGAFIIRGTGLIASASTLGGTSVGRGSAGGEEVTVLEAMVVL